MLKKLRYFWWDLHEFWHSLTLTGMILFAGLGLFIAVWFMVMAAIVKLAWVCLFGSFC